MSYARYEYFMRAPQSGTEMGELTNPLVRNCDHGAEKREWIAPSDRQ